MQGHQQRQERMMVVCNGDESGSLAIPTGLQYMRQPGPQLVGDVGGFGLKSSLFIVETLTRC